MEVSKKVSSIPHDVTQGSVVKIGPIIEKMLSNDEAVFDGDVKGTFVYLFLLYIPMVLHIWGTRDSVQAAPRVAGF